MDFEARADHLFGQAREAIARACGVMHADHSKRGTLGGGGTATEAVRIFKEQTSGALAGALDECAKVVEHRGFAWKTATDSVGSALERQIAAAPDIVAPSFRLARFPGASAETAAVALIDKAAEDLRGQLAAFRDGWTAPPAKRWIERHPALYAVALLVIGLLVGQIPQGIAWLKSLRGAPPAITQASPRNPPDAKSEARLNALLKIYRDGHKPVTPDNIRGYMDRVEKAHIAEGALAKEYQYDLYVEQEREARATAARQKQQVDEMIANASK